MLDAEAYGPVEGERAAGDRPATGEPRDTVADLDLERPELVVAVVTAGGGHRIRDQDEPAGLEPGDVADDRGVQVHAVGDDLDDHLRSLQQRHDQAGLAVMDRAFGIEQVSGDPRPGVDREVGVGVRRVGVPRGDDDTGLDEVTDSGLAAEPFDGQRDHPDRALPGGEQPVEVTAQRIGEQVGVVGPAMQLGQPGPLQVDAHQFPVADQWGQRADLSLQHLEGVGHQRGHRRRRPVREVGGQRGPGRVGAVGVGGPAAAVRVHVDEPGNEDPVPQVDDLGGPGSGAGPGSSGHTGRSGDRTGRTGRQRPGADLDDPLALDAHPAVVERLGGEHPGRAEDRGHSCHPGFSA
ncbi:hypothetical protein SDC9_112170 [bioreactor metagenome]|uniref:Uncharacterized protein n=1 Tax=bioreactor metagenome TaxID=1076179 RepID=A0A645BIQ9_9ZZZZ